MMYFAKNLFALLSLCFCIVNSQDYAEYARGYTQKKKGGGSGMVTSVISGAAGLFVGSWMSSRSNKKKLEKEKKELLQYMQLQVRIIDNVYHFLIITILFILHIITIQHLC